jgi:hypothetical protein
VRLVPLALFGALAAAFAGCSNTDCERSTDCPTGQFCDHGTCRDLGPVSDVPPQEDVAPRDDGAGGDGPDDVSEPDGETGEGATDGADVFRCSTDTECDDGEPCTTDRCDTTDGRCSNTALGDGASCEDGVRCNGAESCRDGRCGSGVPACPPEVVHGCTRDGCDEATVTCGTWPLPDGTLCAVTSDVCGARTGTCLEGTCQIGLATTCDDANICTEDLCTPDAAGTGTVCTHRPVAIGTTCTDGIPCHGSSGRSCVGGDCAIGLDAPCSDGSLCLVTSCSGAEACAPVDPPPAWPALRCETSVSGSTALSLNDVASYNGTCGSDLGGGENVWQFDVPSGYSTVELALTGVESGGTLALLALTNLCNPASCIAVADPTGTLSLPVTGALTVYIVVDGRASARGRYGLSVSCR